MKRWITRIMIPLALAGTVIGFAQPAQAATWRYEYSFSNWSECEYVGDQFEWREGALDHLCTNVGGRYDLHVLWP